METSNIHSDINFTALFSSIVLTKTIKANVISFMKINSLAFIYNVRMKITIKQLALALKPSSESKNLKMK